jgi:biopolymer transport protein ExbD
MKLKENFLYKKKETITIPRTKFFIGIASGLLFSFWLYAFLYMSREVFRFFSRTEYYDLLILSNQEIFFYNLFFAFIAVIFGQSICFNYWFDKPRTIFHRSTWRRFSIVNDNRALNWYFLSWFSKIAIAYGIMFCITYGGGTKYFNFYPDYSYLFILVVVVLYLQVWNTFRVTFKKESKKWLLISILVVSTVSLIFSQINFIDHKTLDENFLQKNVYVKYNLDIPSSDFYRFGVERLSLTENIFIVLTHDNNNQITPQIIYEHQELSLDEIAGVANNWLQSRHPAEGFLIDVRAHIDKGVPMSFVNDFKTELSKNGIKRISYVVFPADKEIEKGFHYYHAISTILPYPYEDKIVIADSLIKTYNISNVIRLRIDNSGEYFLNGLIVDKNNLREDIEKELNNDFNSIFIYTYTVNTAYSEFIYGSAQIRKATLNIRDYLSRKEYGVSFNDLRYLPEYDEFIEKYTFLLVDYIEY